MMTWVGMAFLSRTVPELRTATSLFLGTALSITAIRQGRRRFSLLAQGATILMGLVAWVGAALKGFCILR